mgnify:CR=1 FL=1
MTDLADLRNKPVMVTKRHHRIKKNLAFHRNITGFEFFKLFFCQKVTHDSTQ